MKQLSQTLYFPAIRTSQYDLLALLEIEDNRKSKISPILSARGNNKKQIASFSERWGDSIFWIDSSRFAQDTSNLLSASLNDPQDSFKNKRDFLRETSKSNSSCRPIIGFKSGDPIRSVVQFALQTLEEFPIIGLRIEGDGEVLDRNISTAKAILNAVSDTDFERIILIVDRWSQTEMPSLQDEGSIMKSLKLTTEYPLSHILTLSTSWPDERPDRGASSYPPCIDPFWQAQIHDLLKKRGIKCFYGDYAATNPVRDILDDYKPATMAQPIPFAGYFLPFQWYQERQGRSGENEKFREIAQSIRSLPEYHTDEFCWGTKEIKAIATGQRDKAGHAAYWNKIRINQHICGMLKEIESGALEQIANPADMDEDDLI